MHWALYAFNNKTCDLSSGSSIFFFVHNAIWLYLHGEFTPRLKIGHLTFCIWLQTLVVTKYVRYGALTAWITLQADLYHATSNALLNLESSLTVEVKHFQTLDKFLFTIWSLHFICVLAVDELKELLAIISCGFVYFLASFSRLCQ